MKLPRLGRIALVAGALGATLTVLCVLPLPPTTDIYAARRWGVGLGYVGFFLGFPFSILGMPLAVALHPFPVQEGASGAGATLAIVAGMVGLNWAACGAFVAAIVRAIRARARRQR